MPMITRLFGRSFLVAATASCGGGSEGVDPFGPSQTDCSPANTFCMTAGAFAPTSRVVGVNAVAIWINDSGVIHDITFDTPQAALAVGEFLSAGNFQAPDKTSHQRKFAAVGSYAFHCTIHGTATSGMRGTVVVQ